MNTLNKILLILALLAASFAGVSSTADATDRDGEFECFYNFLIAFPGDRCVVVVDNIPDELEDGIFDRDFQGYQAECAHLSSTQTLCVLGDLVLERIGAPDIYRDAAGNLCQNIRNDAGQIVNIICEAPGSLPAGDPVVVPVNPATPAFTG